MNISENKIRAGVKAMYPGASRTWYAIHDKRLRRALNAMWPRRPKRTGKEK